MAIKRTAKEVSLYSNEEESLADGILSLSGRVADLANAITPLHTGPGRDDNGNTVASLTEATMGLTESLNKIARAIEYVGNVLENKV